MADEKPHPITSPAVLREIEKLRIQMQSPKARAAAHAVGSGLRARRGQQSVSAPAEEELTQNDETEVDRNIKS